MRKETIKVRLSKKYLYISLFIMAVCFVSAAVRLTPLIHSYWINLLSAFILNNVISLAIMCISSFIIFLIEIKKYNEVTKEGER